MPTFGSSVKFIFFLFQPDKNRGVKDGYQILSWDKSQTQVIPSLSTIISYLQRSNVLRCPTLVLLSQTCFFFYYFLVAMVTIEAVGFKPRWSLILEMNFPLPVWVLCTKMIFAPEWPNARNGIYMTKSRTSFNKQLVDYWIFIKGMYHWRGSLCLSSSYGHHERGKFTRIESLVPNVSVIEPNVFSFITVW